MTIQLATSTVLSVIQTTGFFAPIAFILFHMIRQFLFIPVAVVCVAGGILFGAQLGSVYSVIGLTGSSIIFYFVTKLFPKLLNRFMRMKEKWLGTYTNFSVIQIIILRMIPFVNFSLISLCILDKTKTFTRYAKLSFLTHIPSTILFTFLGASIQALPPVILVGIVIVLFILIYYFREKQVFIKWNDFFIREKA
ncbi:alkaline phosphatase [Bacillus sp. UMB0899]|uniref:TVP38/TMEM64 family protein n=1 Tax=Metabacillus schmidteae TaxID=2730405 RepID=UPI000C80358A|nr:VTT domain-containing protein [Metabacillus schmidteae]PMC37087.1 alkaline phosphatase [Bacillus sp. UMB0899]